MAARARSTHDMVRLAGMPLSLYRPSKGAASPISSSHAPLEAGQQATELDVPRVWDDFTGGMGYRYRKEGVRNTYYYADRMTCRWPRMAMPAGKLTSVPLPSLGANLIRASVEFNGHLFFFAGPHVVIVPNGTGTPYILLTSSADSGNFAAQDAEAWDRVVIVSGVNSVTGLPGHIHKLDYNTGTGVWSYTTNDALGIHLARVYWVVDNFGSDRLITSYDYHTLKALPTGVDAIVQANWSATYPMEPSTIINSLAASPRTVIAATRTGVRTMDERGYAANLTPYWTNLPDASQNGATSVIYGDHAVITHALGIDYVPLSGERQEAPQWIWPMPGVSEGILHGDAIGLGSDAGWVVGGINRGDCYVIYGRPRGMGVPDGPGAFLWHGAEAVVPGVFATHFKVTQPQAQPRMWIAGFSGAVPKLWWLSLPKGSSPLEDWLDHTGHVFEPFSRIYLPAEDWGDAGSPKVMRRFDITIENLRTGSYGEIFARELNGTWESQGRATGFGTVSNVLYPSTGLLLPHHPEIYVALQGTETQPLVLDFLKARAEVLVEQYEERTYTVVLKDRNRLRNGAPSRTNSWSILGSIEALQAEGPVEMVDHLGRDITVKVEPRIVHKQTRLPDGDYGIVVEIPVTVLSGSAYTDSAATTSSLWRAS